MKKIAICIFPIFLIVFGCASNDSLSVKDYKGKKSLELYNLGMVLREQYRGKEEVLKEIDEIAEELISRDNSKFQGFLLKSWVLKREAYLNSIDGYTATKFQKSLDYLNGAIGKEGTTLDIYPAVISSAIILNNFKKAEVLLNEFKIKINQSNQLDRYFDYYSELANFYLKQQKFDDSRKAVTECLVYAKNSFQKLNCLYYKAESFSLENKLKESVDTYNDILKLIPDDPWTLSNISAVYYRLQLFDDAIDAAEKGLGVRKFEAIKNNLNWGYYGKASELLKKGDKDLALEFFMKIDRNDIEIQLAEFLAKKLTYNFNGNELFLKVVQPALNKFPDNSKLNFLMGEYYYISKKEIKEGLKYYHRAEQVIAGVNDKDLEMGIYTRLGWIYSFNLKDSTKGLEYYIKLRPLAELSKNQSVMGDAYYGLGRCYHDLGWTRKELESSKLGLSNYQEALKYKPEKKSEIEKNIKNLEVNIANFSKN